ncbi:MAG: type II toxin-antitoxin system PemK/MazF family toxin [Acidobacteria bacterium]|nr:type II toxin-antitoxin system PemK/MazF family toxin [Acidobacteriota bacterium]
MKRGEIRWYRFAQPDKRRPVLILTRDSVLQYLGEATIAPITRTVRDIPSEVFLSKDDGMHRDCAVNCDHLQTVSKTRIGALITSLPRERMAAVGRAIRFALALP